MEFTRKIDFFTEPMFKEMFYAKWLIQKKTFFLSTNYLNCFITMCNIFITQILFFFKMSYINARTYYYASIWKACNSLKSEAYLSLHSPLKLHCYVFIRTKVSISRIKKARKQKRFSKWWMKCNVVYGCDVLVHLIWWDDAINSDKRVS